MSQPVPVEELLRALSAIVAAAAEGKPITGTELGQRIGMSKDAAFRRRDLLADRGWITLVSTAFGAVRLHPTPAALKLELPPAPIRRPRPAPAPGPVTRLRPCLGCRTQIASEGAHHRHCSRCRRALTEADGAARFAP